MGTFNITSSVLNRNYNYVNTDVIVEGNYSIDESESTVKSVSGTVYHQTEGERGEYIGNFNGFVRNEELKYSISELGRKDSTLVWNAIEEIESHIMPQDNN